MFDLLRRVLALFRRNPMPIEGGAAVRWSPKLAVLAEVERVVAMSNSAEIERVTAKAGR